MDPWPEAAFVSLLSRSEVFVVVGARTDQFLPDGFILVRTVAGEAEVLTFCVAESARKCGLGRALLDAACCIAAGRASGEMFLEVSENNAAAFSLYQKTGFVAVGRRAAYYRHGLLAADAIVMRKPLSDASPDIVEGHALSFRSGTESTKRN
ncbi:MAG: GNAT family N-acetyltransferase [Alphaproteobacteria bacterium]|nr:GNAT family N-acetyltransferase [Alphaproteobacteria bacterium]